jgi:TRAP-type C4-dicarboxylate transport system substrate-binding protein
VVANEQGRAGGAGGSVPAGASVQEWQAALADIEPVNIVYQAALPAGGPLSQRVVEWADKVSEYSNGKVKVEIVWSYGIAGINESDEALLDGRIDSHNFNTFFSPSEYPVNGKLMLDTTVKRDSSLLEGGLTMLGAMNQTAWETPGATKEFTDRGLNPIMPVASAQLSGLACSEPVTSLADLKGKMIRTGPLVQVGQVEALGATSVNLPFTELYEALQRGIVDCIIYGVPGLSQGDLLTVAPYVITPVGTSFATLTASELTGMNWPSWPLPVQQLMFDSINEMVIGLVPTSMKMMEDVAAKAKQNGGGFLEFDDEVNERLKAHNAKVLDGVAASTATDGKQLVAKADDHFATWSDLVSKAGYSSATLTEFEGELSGKKVDLTAFLDLYRERVLIPNRPS